MVDVFKEGEFELLILSETKLKGNGNVSWCWVNGIIVAVQEMERAMESCGYPVERCVAQWGIRIWIC